VRNELLPRLERAGRRVCIDYRDFDPGASRPTEVQRAVLTSRRTILVLTPAYLTDEWAALGDLMLQASDPAARKRRLIPLLKERCELPLRLGHLWAANFVDPVDREMAWNQLLRAV
jgi:hypothetical protein